MYLDPKVESLSATLSTDASDRTKAPEDQTLKFPGNKDQYLFNASLEDSLEAITRTLQMKNEINQESPGISLAQEVESSRSKLSATK